VSIESKEQRALELIKGLGSVAVAFSGGVDSALVCSLAKEALGDKAIAVIGRSPLHPDFDLEFARRIAGEIGIALFEIDVPVMSDGEFVKNPADRCYRCKTIMLKSIIGIAGKHNIQCVVDGSTNDDVSDIRPGMKAKKELGVRSPLLETGISKEDVRAISMKRGLASWNRPSAACLASRIPYETEITVELLERIGRAERFLRSNGLTQVRVRAHGNIARIEVDQEEMPLLFQIRDKVVRELKKEGFIYISMDIQGFRSGSMNEVL
jgi:uncharacterized protein